MPVELQIPDIVWQQYADYQDACAGRTPFAAALDDAQRDPDDDEIKIGGTD